MASAAENILAKLLAVRDEHCRAALTNGGDRSSYEFGRRCGVYEGLTRAIQEVTCVRDEEKQDKQL